MAKEEIYVEISSMAAKKTFDKKYMKTLPRVMQATTSKAIKKAGGLTTKKGKGKNGFYIHGTLETLTKQQKGAKTTISCKVSMVIATLPKKSMFGFLKGGAQVQTGSSEKDIEFAAQDCVEAVIDNLVKSKAVKAIKSKAAA